MAYSHNEFWNNKHEYQKDDLILSGCYYCPSTDTIRTPENYCLVSFVSSFGLPLQEGIFAKFCVFVDGATKDYRKQASNVMTNSAYFCTEMRNDKFGNKSLDYLKRRAAWLIGQKLLKERKSGIWCSLNMEACV